MRGTATTTKPKVIIRASGRIRVEVRVRVI